MAARESSARTAARGGSAPGRRRPRRWPLVGVALVAAGGAVVLWAALGASGRQAPEHAAGPADPPPGPPPAAADAVAELVTEVLAVYPHDPSAYTQGLVWDGGALYESTGLYGESSLRRVALASGEVLRRVDLPPDAFGEGLALVPADGAGAAGRLVQLTWREGRAFAYDADTFERRGTFTYAGEGWGLCFDGRRLVRSDGRAELVFHQPGDFAVIGRVQVTLRGQPVQGLNELECVAGEVWANVYTTSAIARIDPASGRVTGVVDASGLLTAEEARGAEVLNGIAYNPARDTFYLTGKRWPKLFEVRFVPR